MYEKIPIMDEQETKEIYANQIRDLLGDDSFWNISVAGFTPGLIVRPKDTNKIKDNGCGAIERVYILGVQKREDYKGIKGLGIVTWNINGTDFYNSLVNEMGYRKIPKDGEILFSTFEKSIDTTVGLMIELKALEELVR